MLIDGKKVSSKIKAELKAEIDILKQTGRVPKLAVVLVGEDPASKVYVRQKEKACEAIGIENLLIRKEASLSEEDLLALIDELKDVDGFHPESIASLFLNRGGFVSCTPAGVMALLDDINYDLSGKEVVVVGRSHNVGKPLALLALARNATVTLAHSKTKDLDKVCQRADVLIAAAGKAKLIDEHFVKKGAVVIDVGITRLDNGKLCGDVDFEKVEPIASAITPVPGGVGPMTVALLMKNTVKAYKKGLKK